MLLYKYFKIAMGALSANKSRAALTMLGIIIGVGAVILLVSIGTGLRTYILRQMENLGSNLVMVLPGKLEMRPGGGGAQPGIAASKLTYSDASAIKTKADLVKNVVPLFMTNTSAKFGKENKTTQVAGVTSDYPEVRNAPVEKGEFFNEAQVKGGKKVCAIGATLVDEFFGGLDPLGKRLIIGDQKYTILGVMAKKGAIMGTDLDDQVLIPITSAQRQFGADYVNFIYAQAESAEEIEGAKKQTEKVLLERLNPDDFTVMKQEEILTTISQILGTLTLALGGIAAISLLVGGIGIMNIMLVSVTERTREIGMRKAVGAKYIDILSQFLIEAVVLSVVGGIIGIGLGIGGSLLLGRFFTVTISLWAILVAFFFSAAVGIIFGIAPAIRAARLDPIEALRYE